MSRNIELELLETINLQDQLITKQSETITKLVNENAEQGNFINEILRERTS